MRWQSAGDGVETETAGGAEARRLALARRLQLERGDKRAPVWASASASDWAAESDSDSEIGLRIGTPISHS